MVLLAFAMSVDAYTIVKMDSTNINNRTIVGGTSTGSTAVFNFQMGLNAGNFTARMQSNATGATTWTTMTMAGISGNTTCFSNSSCFRPGAGTGGDSFKTTITLPSDVRHAYLRLEVNGSANRSQILTFDSTKPVLTFTSPTQDMNARRNNGSWTINMTTGENVTSCTITKEPNTVVTTATLANSDQAGWVAYSSQAAARYSFSGTCLDYAADGANSGSTSENRIVLKNSDPSPVIEQVISTTRTDIMTRRSKMIVLWILVAVFISVFGLAVAIKAGKGKRRRR